MRPFTLILLCAVVAASASCLVGTMPDRDFDDLSEALLWCPPDRANTQTLLLEGEFILRDLRFNHLVGHTDYEFISYNESRRAKFLGSSLATDVAPSVYSIKFINIDFDFGDGWCAMMHSHSNAFVTVMNCTFVGGYCYAVWRVSTGGGFHITKNNVTDLEASVFLEVRVDTESTRDNWFANNTFRGYHGEMMRQVIIPDPDDTFGCNHPHMSRAPLCFSRGRSQTRYSDAGLYATSDPIFTSIPFINETL